MRKSAFLWAFWAVVWGGFIYLLLRPDTIRFFSWIDLVRMGTPIELIRNYCNNFYPFIPKWVVFSLPNALWALSYALIITHIWWGYNSAIRYFWLGSIPVVGVGHETLQYMGVIAGTFCYHDLMLCAVGVSVGIAVSILDKNKGRERS